MTTTAPEAPAEVRTALPAQIADAAAAELPKLLANLSLMPVVVTTLLRVAQNPTGEGVPLGPCEAVHYAPLGRSGYVVLYTYVEHVTIVGFKKVVGL